MQERGGSCVNTGVVILNRIQVWNIAGDFEAAAATPLTILIG
jgi:hypothetical protein